jgi:hypothetical protein
MERVQASRGSEAIKHFPLQKRVGGDGDGSHQGRMCCYLATQTIANRHYLCVCVLCQRTPASVALPSEIVNCCGLVTRDIRVCEWGRTKPLINTSAILRISADKCTTKILQGVSNVSSRKNSIVGCYSNDKRKVRPYATEPESLHFQTRAVSLRHLEQRQEVTCSK